MNETINPNTITVYEQVQAYEPAGLGGEVIENFNSFPRLDGEVMPLVAANEHVVAPCRWMGGVEVTLTTAMINYPELMTEENADQILADIREFLASQRIEREILDEELDEEEEAPEKERSKSEEEKTGKLEQQLTKKPEAGNKIKNKVEVREPQPEERVVESSSRPAAESQRIEQIEVAEDLPQESSGPAQNLSVSVKKPIPVTTEREVAADNTVGLRSKDSPGGSDLPEAIPAVNADMELEADLQMPVFELHETEPADAATHEAESAPDGPPSDEVQVAEYLTPPEVAELEPVATTVVETEDIFIMDDRAEPAGDETEAAAEVPALEVLDYLAEADSDFAFAVGASGLGLEQSEPVVSREPQSAMDSAGEEAPLARQYAELFFTEQTGAEAPERPVRMIIPIGELESSLIQLAEHLEDGEPKEAEAAAEAVDKIIEIIATPYSRKEENLFTEEEVQEALEGLFTELFQVTGTAYTPELIESLVYFTIRIPLSVEVEKLRDIDQVASANKDRATHEIIKELLMCMNTSKKVATNAWAIGKSALRLYSFSF